MENMGLCLHMLRKFCEKRIQVSSALAYLHSIEPYPILHQNLKPSNILGVLVGSDSESGKRLIWKLADFGLAQLLNKRAKSRFYADNGLGKYSYLAPEVVSAVEKYSSAADIWSLGAVISFYINSQHLFSSPQNVLDWTSSSSLPIVGDISKLVKR